MRNALTQWLQGIDLEWVLTELFIVVIAAISLSFHEFCHALAANLQGDDTAKRVGRLSLNPLRHVSWPGLLMLAVFRFGWAKPVPVNMYRFRNPKLGMALTALAGPVANVLLALLGSLGLHILLAVIWAPPYNGVVVHASFLYYAFVFVQLLVLLNTGLAVFNLIPISPLDGSKILGIVLPQRAYGWLMRYERYGMFVLMALLFTGLLNTPLQFLRNGLSDGLLWLTGLPFAPHPTMIYYR